MQTHAPNVRRSPSAWHVAMILAAACDSSGPEPSQPIGDGATAVPVTLDGGDNTTTPTIDGSSGPGSDARDAAPPSASDAASQPSDASTTARGECKARFTTSTRVSVDLSWSDGLAYVGGKGKSRVWSKDTYTPTENGYTLESVPCGLSIPVVTGSDLIDSLQFALDFPASDFDAPTMPRFAGRAEWRGGSLVTELDPFVLGTMLSDPAAAWPARAMLVSIDHDGDGKPGITSIPKRNAPFTLLPLDIGFTKFASELYFTTRTSFRRSAARPGCSDRIEESAEPLAFDYTVIGCHVLDRDTCTEREANLLSNNLPVFTTGTAEWTSLPIAASATCGDVLAALPVD